MCNIDGYGKAIAYMTYEAEAIVATLLDTYKPGSKCNKFIV